MRILLKCPSRARPKQLLETLTKYVTMASKPELMGIVISCDVDDSTMTPEPIQRQVFQVIDRFAWKALYYGNNKTKIEACNADIEKVEYPWDIVVLVSDDMIPEVRGYDEIIRRTGSLDSILWFNDGFQGYKLNTLSIYGRTMYERLGSMYAPQYKSFYCDTELTDLCKTTLKDKTIYNQTCIIRHRHPSLGYAVAVDALYVRNHKYFEEDLRTYISRKQYECDLSILIPTLVERQSKFDTLTASLREMFARICPGLRLQINELRDNRQMSVGMKRRLLLEQSKGKYSVFIDDDDDVTDAYFEDFLACFIASDDVMRIRGRMSGYTFAHSIEYPLNGIMYTDMFVRPPNHLNPMLTEFARLSTFEDASRGEDLKWTIDLAKTGILKHETRSDPSRIHYNYNVSMALDPRVIEYQKTHTYEEWVKTLLVPAKPRTSVLRLGSRGFVSK